MVPFLLRKEVFIIVEEWKPIEGFEGLYEVSNTGKVKSLERLVPNHSKFQLRKERLLKQNISNNRHSMVVLCKDSKTYPKLVHRLVAIAFIPNPENKPVVDHIDTNPFNNNVDNLKWATVQENCMNPLTRVHNSISKKGHPYYGRPLTEEEREKIRTALRGKKASEETKKKLSEAHKNSEKAMLATYENLKKAHVASIGSKRSEETKEKMRKAKIGFHKGKSWKLENGKRVWYDKEVC